MSLWIPCSERVPENPTSVFDVKEYLVWSEKGYSTVLPWADGWNCGIYTDGKPSKENEIKGIVAWMELPEPYNEEERKEDDD